MTAERIWLDLQDALRNYLQAKVQDNSLAEDLLHEVFLKIQKNLHQLEDVSKVNHWIFRIAHHTVMDHFRQQRKEPDWSEAPSLLQAWEDNQTPDETRQLARWLPLAIQGLPPKYREALWLTDIEGLSQKELAERMNISYSGAKSRVQRARQMLKEAILECCHVQSDSYGNILDYQPRICPKEDCG